MSAAMSATARRPPSPPPAQRLPPQDPAAAPLGAPATPPLLPDASAAVAWLRARLPPGGTLCADSRAVRAGDAFLAWPGQTADARRFVAGALASGAAACLVEAEGAAGIDFGQAGAASGRVAALHGLKAAAGAIADEWFGHPSRALSVVAITGTNGKTSSAWWTAMALRTLGERAGVVGTLGIGEPPQLAGTGLTTPDAVTVHAAMRRLADAGCRACAIEASSIGLVDQRLVALKIDVAVLTNFTRDHLDFHGTMSAYWAAKRRLFDWPGLRAAVVNVDDAQGAALAAELRSLRAGNGAAAPELWTVSTLGAARLVAGNVRYEAGGLAFDVVERIDEGAGAAREDRAAVAGTLVGEYNVHNLLGVLATLRALGQPLAAAARALSGASAVPGRLQRIAGRDVEVVVDYAHTPDALAKVLAALRPLAAARGGRLSCVFGCGGDRDTTKRALMGGIAERGADRVVITSDNPRGEQPGAIIADIRAGMSAAAQAVALVEDRREAIRLAVLGAATGDVVLLAGKGHEDTQEIAGVRRPFSDLDEARAALLVRDGAADAAAPMTTLAQVHAMLPGSRLVGDGSVAITRVHSDTRSLRPGDFFVALAGERFDGNDYLDQARASGAAAALAHPGRLAPGPGLPGLPGVEVPDTLAALQQLASAWRARFAALPVVAVTGSNGKTTVTQMLAAMLERAFGSEGALATRGNLNNHIGVPLMLLELRGRHRMAALELGTNHVGEIAHLAGLVRPTVALINNAQREHQEFLAGVEAVARENGSVIDSVAAGGAVVLPHADAYTPLWREMARARGIERVVTFGFEPAADVSASAAWQAAPAHWQITLRTPRGSATAALHQPGRHNALNAVAAAACALAAGLPLAAITEGLAAFEPVAGRTRVLRLVREGVPLTLVDDSYNANPDSVRAAIDLLADQPGPRWLVLGDMGEVGAQGPEFHAEVGAHARARRIEHCWAAGSASAGLGFGRHFADTAALIAALPEAPPAASVLVKGSRFMRMEAVVRALVAAWGVPAGVPGARG